ncbi:MAG: glycosyltransferase [Bacteroidetes bacterium]|nr:glycosyltransferase [Bacteroidota bacterium]
MIREIVFEKPNPVFVNAPVLTVEKNGTTALEHKTKLPELLFISSFPPRECGIATYSQDLIRALNTKFSNSFTLKICPLESENEIHSYAEDIEYVLNTDHPDSFFKMAKSINANDDIQLVVIQHEFGFFEKNESEFRHFLFALRKPVVIVFHTVLQHPNETLKEKVQQIAAYSESIIVMTNYSANVLIEEYSVPKRKIIVIPHGTHLVQHSDKQLLKAKYKLNGKKVLSTFGLLGSGKSIETTLNALPQIIECHPDVRFLIIGKTHPSVKKQEGEKYREHLEQLVDQLHLQPYVQFINSFLPLPDLLEYLQLTDIYLFTSRDPNQAVSGTFSYAISCGCPVISTAIPHAREVLRDDAGIIIDFENPQQLSLAVNTLLKDDIRRAAISSNALHRMASTAWENSAIAHARLFEKITGMSMTLKYSLPEINLDHIRKLTTPFGMIQFSKINQPDMDSGYTLDDNARALIALCQHYELTGDKNDIELIEVYFNFITYCLQPECYFLNYVNEQKVFTEQNNSTNLADSNGRAIWALGYLISLSGILPDSLTAAASIAMQTALSNVRKIHSTRAMAFVIKGLYYSYTYTKSIEDQLIIKEFSDRLVQMYRHEADNDWEWFESYLTYANSTLPEAMLCAWIATNDPVYKEIAKSTFDFLLSKTFAKNQIKVISNKNWLHKGEEPDITCLGGEQPIDVAYTIIALGKFYDVFKEEKYLKKMHASFNWFLGTNHLHQVIYNPCTGGCYDGLEENYVNLNQGAESTISYLMARLTLQKTLIDLTIAKHITYTTSPSEQKFDLEFELFHP